MLFEKVINRKYKILEAGPLDPANANDAQAAQKGQEGSDWTPENADKQDAATDKLKLSMDTMHTQLQNVIAKFINFLAEEQKTTLPDGSKCTYSPKVNAVLAEIGSAMTNETPEKAFDAMKDVVDSAFSEFEKEPTLKTYEQ